jgi:ribose 5-phosphate isomerase B
MKLVIAADHRGFAHKEYIKQQASLANVILEWFDVGADDDRRTDYPIFAQKACQVILEGKAERGVLLCGSGVGMSIAANRYCGIYAGLAWNEEVARQSREDDNANVLVIPSDFVTKEQAVAMVNVWLAAEFREGRYQDRIDMIDAMGCLEE